MLVEICNILPSVLYRACTKSMVVSFRAEAAGAHTDHTKLHHQPSVRPPAEQH